jgi:uncharacterized protein YrrD
MKRTVKSLIGYTIQATDGEIGNVKEFYFDDRTWTIRYLVVETGSWLFGRKILLSTEALLAPDWKKHVFPVNLTTAQINGSPEIDTNKPVSRQHEMDLFDYYPWGTYYWGSGMVGNIGMGMSYPVALNQEEQKETDESDSDNTKGDPHLRSTDAVTGYTIKATDGDIGEVEDFIINDQDWKIKFMEVDTGNWIPGKMVLISPKLVRVITLESNSVMVNATVEQVENSPEYDSRMEITDPYEINLHDYYGKFLTHK